MLSTTAPAEGMTLPHHFTPQGLQGEVVIPGDKSISHRSLMLSALMPNPCTIEGLLPSADVTATRLCLEAMGLQTRCTNEAQGAWAVQGLPQWHTPASVLDCQNSGTTMRLLSGLVAGQNRFAVLNGDVSLNQRPMGRVLVPLKAMGAHALGKEDNRFAPLVFVPQTQPLQGMHYRLPMASAQVKSALLFASLFASPTANGGTLVLEDPLPTRDHSERMLGALSFTSHSSPLAGGGQTLSVPCGQLATLQQAPSQQWVVPGDPSSAAFWVVAALLIPGSHVVLKNVGCNPTRIGLVQALRQVGAHIAFVNERTVGGEVVADWEVRYSELKGDLTLQAEAIPALVDEIPVLTVACLWLNGTLSIRGAEELRKKESDRLAAMATELAKLGVSMALVEDGLDMVGNPATVLQAPAESLQTWHDHRIAMALSVANAVHNARCPQQAALWPMANAGIVSVSYPTFFAVWHQLAQG